MWVWQCWAANGNFKARHHQSAIIAQGCLSLLESEIRKQKPAWVGRTSRTLHCSTWMLFAEGLLMTDIWGFDGHTPASAKAQHWLFSLGAAPQWWCSVGSFIPSGPNGAGTLSVSDWDTRCVQTTELSCCVRKARQKVLPGIQVGAPTAPGLTQVAGSHRTRGQLPRFRKERDKRWVFHREDGRGRDRFGKPDALSLQRLTDKTQAVRLYASEISTALTWWWWL